MLSRFSRLLSGSPPLSFSKIAILLIGHTIFASGSIRATPLSERLEKIISKTGISKENFGLAVMDLSRDGGALEFGLNQEKDFTPASVTKIATASTVLRELGSSYKFQTTLWGLGHIKNGVLKSDLFLKGGGDPGFVSETMWFLVNELVRTGIKNIEGDLVVDDTNFDSIRVDASRDPERVDRAYDAPIGAMSFNWNSLNVFVRPGEVGKNAVVILDPIDGGFKIENKAKTVKGRKTQVEVSREGGRIVVRGSIGQDADEFVAYKNIDDPAIWSGQNLKFFLEQRGISLKGRVRSGKVDKAANLLAKAESKPVNQHVMDMMKFSNNYVAEMLTKDLAMVKGKTPASLSEGMAIIRDNVASLGVSRSRFNLINPSGLSRKNKIKPIDLSRILAASYQNFPIFPEFLSAFPIAGRDGTLKRRMKDTEAEGWVRAKTGLLTGVVALAGYATRKDGSIRAFSFIYNGRADRGEAIRQLFDRLATELVR